MTTLEKIKLDIKDCLWKLSEGNTYLDITREEVENAILEIIDKYAEQEPCRVKNELNLELNELKPCDDVVSRQAVLDVIKSLSNANPSYWNNCDVVDREYLIDEISELPSVTKKPIECDDAVSRESVLLFIEKVKESGIVNYGSLLDIATEVRNLPSVTQKPIECDDAVSRQAVLDINESHHGQMPNHINHQIWQEIKELPSVRPQEQKSGKWIAQQEPNGDDYFKAYDISGVMTYAAKYKCDKCGFIQTCIEDHGQYTFCPNCGCRMVDPRENEKTAYEKCPICGHRNNSCLFGSPECNFEEEQ